MLEFEKIINIPTPIIEIFDPLFEEKMVKVFVKRDDLCHPVVSGNKFRKLKYNLLEAEKNSKNKILTFGGAYSNHVAAVAEAAKLFGFEATIIIRGDELSKNSSQTLQLAFENGVELIFVTRTAYKDKSIFEEKYKATHYIIPEGGTNTLALKGVSEMVDEIVNFSPNFDFICTSIGTGGTMAGICTNSIYNGKVLGASVLKNGEFLKTDIANLMNSNFPSSSSIELDFHFGGYAKYNDKLLDFIDYFENKHKFLIDQVYTGKLFYAIYEKIKNDFFQKGSNILVVHTGGLQGKLKKD